MRVFHLMRGDLRFQRKYGFYAVYLILVILYLLFLSALPASIRMKTAVILILTDPATMGLFFMGAIVLLEKSQRVLNSLAVSPIRPEEYVFAKAGSIALISLLVSIVLGVSAKMEHIGGIVCGTLFGSMIYTMIGLGIGVKARTLNAFIVLTIPVEIVSFVPAILYLFVYQSDWMLLHPMCAMIELFEGRERFWLALILLMIWAAGVLWLTAHLVKRSLKSIGGIRL